MINVIESFFANDIGLDSYDNVNVTFSPHISPYHAPKALNSIGGAPPHSRSQECSHSHGHQHSHPLSDEEDCHNNATRPSNEVDQSMLEHYCFTGQLANVVLLYAQGVSVARQLMISGTNATPLMWAALKGRISVAKFLIDVGVGVNVTADDGQGALHWAVNEGRLEMIQLLLQNHADPTLQDIKGFSPYTVAIQKENLAALLILHNHTPINTATQDNDKHSYVHWAAYRGSLSILQYLHVMLGADLTTTDKHKRTALHWAAREGHAEVCEYLMNNGMSPNDVDIDGMSCIHHSRARNHIKALDVLSRVNMRSLSSSATGTVTAIAQSKWFALAAVIGIFYPLLAWGVTLYIPPMLCPFLFSFFVCKNVFFQFIIPKPIKAGTSIGEQSIPAEVGVPTTFVGIFRGMWTFRRREVINVFALVSFIFVQIIVISQASDRITSVIGVKDISHFSTKYEYISLSTIIESYLGPLFPQYTLIFLLMSFCFGLITKFTSFKSMINPGPIETHPSFDAVRNNQLYLLDPHIIDQDQNLRLPVRAFYCIELDRCFKKYDSWSLLLDCPIAASNHHYFVLFILFLALYQSIIWCTYMSHIVWSYCPADRGQTWPSATPSTPNTTHVSDSGFSASRMFLYISYVVVSNILPCAEYIPQSASIMQRYVWPTKVNILGIWVLLCGWCVTFSLIVVLVRQLLGASLGYTRMEARFPYVISEAGRMVHIFRRGGHTIYSVGIIRNLMLFFTGRSGLSSEGVFVMPSHDDSISTFASYGHKSECRSGRC